MGKFHWLCLFFVITYTNFALPEDNITKLFFSGISFDLIVERDKGLTEDKFKAMIESDSTIISQYNNNCITPLHEAIALKFSTNFIEYLLDKGINVNAVDVNKCIPLHWAIYGNSDFSVIDFLVKHGANVNSSTKGGFTSLDIALGYGLDLKIIEYLIEHGADINAYGDDDTVPLHNAIAYKATPEVVRFLIENGADVNAQDGNGHTPLELAIMNNSCSEIIEFLVANNAVVRPYKGSPLHFAIETRAEYKRYNENKILIETIKVLIRLSKNINSLDSGGNTPLDVARRKQDSMAITELIKAGADTSIRSQQ